MDRLDPQLIIFLVFIVISGLSRLFSLIKKGKTKNQPAPNVDEYDYEEERQSDFPPPIDDHDPLRDFRRMLDKARREAEAAEREEQTIPRELASAPERPAPPAMTATTPVTPPPIPNIQNAVSSQSSTVADDAFTIPQQTFSASPTPQVSHSKTNTGGSRSRKSSHRKTHVKSLLSSPSAARDAIILSEVLGKPKGITS